jgi:hypothetical protein
MMEQTSNPWVNLQRDHRCGGSVGFIAEDAPTSRLTEAYYVM